MPKAIKINCILLTLASVLIIGCTAVSAEKPTSDYFNEIINEFKALEKGGRASGETWFELAVKARTAGELEIANQSLARAESEEFSPVRIGLERARVNIAGNNPNVALAEIQKLSDSGFTSVGVLTNDSVINELAGTDAYDALIEKMSDQAYPCAGQPGFNDFNFWVGEWDVALANGTNAGTNSITIAERGCVIIENWTSANSGTGMSINYLDKTTDEWVQIWNAESGSQINIRGGLTDDGMRLVGHIHYVSNGTTAPFRALWTPLADGRVRQFFEQSNDGGETWVPWFEGFYTRTN